MSAIERLTITMPADLAAAVKAAVAGGDYASTSEVMREALRDWKMKRALQQQEFAALQKAIELGLADAAAGRTVEFSVPELIAKGKQLLASRSPSG